MAPFEIVIDDTMLRATVRGYWTIDTAHLYAKTLMETAQSAGYRVRRWLIVLTDSPVQSIEVSEMLKDALRQANEKFSPKIAVVGNSALVSMQAKRVGQNAGHRSFTSVAEAEAWLTSETVP